MACSFARVLVNQGKRVLLVAMTNSATDHLASVSADLGVNVLRHYSEVVTEDCRVPSLPTTATSDVNDAMCVATTAAGTGSESLKKLYFDFIILDEVKYF